VKVENSEPRSLIQSGCFNTSVQGSLRPCAGNFISVSSFIQSFLDGTRVPVQIPYNLDYAQRLSRHCPSEAQCHLEPLRILR